MRALLFAFAPWWLRRWLTERRRRQAAAVDADAAVWRALARGKDE